MGLLLLGFALHVPACRWGCNSRTKALQTLPSLRFLVTDCVSRQAEGSFDRGISAMEDTGIAIIGAGVCGVLAGHQCAEQGIEYCILERETQIGGVWDYRANSYSQLQVQAVVNHSQHAHAT